MYWYDKTIILYITLYSITFEYVVIIIKLNLKNVKLM